MLRLKRGDPHTTANGDMQAKTIEPANRGVQMGLKNPFLLMQLKNEADDADSQLNADCIDRIGVNSLC